MKTLPSEAAQELAQYIRQREDEILHYFPGESDRVIWTLTLAQVIQDYWDSLNEHN